MRSGVENVRTTPSTVFADTEAFCAYWYTPSLPPDRISAWISYQSAFMHNCMRCSFLQRRRTSLLFMCSALPQGIPLDAAPILPYDEMCADILQKEAYTGARR